MNLLNDLERIGDKHEELYDSEVREQAGNALMESFVRNTSGYTIPMSLGMCSGTTNAMLRAAISQFVDCASAICKAEQITGFHHRLLLLQDNIVKTKQGKDYDEFIGHTPPDWYDPEGNVIWDRVK